MAKVLVIGDVMLDKFSYGETRRLNPEAPSPLLNITREEYKLWGAGNVGANIASLLWDCDLCGCIGADMHGEIMRQYCDKNRIWPLFFEISIPTITKQRFIETTYHQQLLRVDYEEKYRLTSEQITLIIERIKGNPYEFVVISDYDKGMICEEFFIQLKAVCEEKNIKILMDAKPNTYSYLQGAYLLKPNFKEFCKIIGKEIKNTDTEIEEYGKQLVKEKQSNIVVTRAEKGATLITLEGETIHLPTKAKQVFDVTGAWDTFISAIVFGLAQGESLFESVALGNKASGIVVSKIGTEKVSKEELFLV